MAKVSVLILAKNEEKFIGACLDSVKSFADEIVVIDDLSTDKTAEICRQHGARVIQRAIGFSSLTPTKELRLNLPKRLKKFCAETIKNLRIGWRG